MISSKDLLRISDDNEFELRAQELAAMGPEGEAVVVAALDRARGIKPFALVPALGAAAPGGPAEERLIKLIETGKDLRELALYSWAQVRKQAATPLLAEIVASHPSFHMRLTALESLAELGDRRGRQTVLDYFTRVLSRKGRRDMIPPLVSSVCFYLLRTAEGPAETQQVAHLLAKRRNNLTELDVRWLTEYWPGEWLTDGGTDAPMPDVESMRRFNEDPKLQRPYHDLY
ncbi:MAG: hypothetical protein ACTHOD_13695 [Motilibacteraceae bacterium]